MSASSTDTPTETDNTIQIVVQQLRTRQKLMMLSYVGLGAFSLLARYTFFGHVQFRLTLVACAGAFVWAVIGVVIANVVRLQTFKRFWGDGGLRLIGLILGQKKFWQVMTMWTGPSLIAFFLSGDVGYWLVLVVLMGSLFLTQPSQAMQLILDPVNENTDADQDSMDHADNADPDEVSNKITED